MPHIQCTHPNTHSQHKPPPDTNTSHIYNTHEHIQYTHHMYSTYQHTFTHPTHTYTHTHTHLRGVLEQSPAHHSSLGSWTLLMSAETDSGYGKHGRWQMQCNLLRLPVPAPHCREACVPSPSAGYTASLQVHEQRQEGAGPMPSSQERCTRVSLLTQRKRRCSSPQTLTLHHCTGHCPFLTPEETHQTYSVSAYWM